MPATRTRARSNHITDDDSGSRTRARSRRSHSLMAETDRHVIRPAKRAVRSARRSIGRSVSGLPGWVPWVAGGVGVAAIVYGLLQIEAVRDFASRATEPISELFDTDEFDENGYDEEYSSADSDFGSRETGGL